jgi:serine/threonine-protein kinase
VGLIDVDWLERCPLLAPLRSTPVFAEIRRKVHARAMAIWA